MAQISALPLPHTPTPTQCYKKPNGDRLPCGKCIFGSASGFSEVSVPPPPPHPKFVKNPSVGPPPELAEWSQPPPGPPPNRV